MKFLEKDLEDIIYNNKEQIQFKGLKIWEYPKSLKIIKRQVRLSSYGIADLIAVEISKIRGYGNCVYRKINVTIIECKLGSIDSNAYFQVCKYKTAVEEYIESLSFNGEVSVRTVLVGHEINKNGGFVYGLNHSRDCDVYTFEYDIDGIKFNYRPNTWVSKTSKISEYNLHKDIINLYKKNCKHMTIEEEKDIF